MIPQWEGIHNDPCLFIAFTICFKFIYCFHYTLNLFIAFRYALNSFIASIHALNTFITFLYALNTFIALCYALNIFIAFIYIYYIIMIIPFPCVNWVWKSLVVLEDYVRPSWDINNHVNPQGIEPMNTPLD